jgi:hypothetical protein
MTNSLSSRGENQGRREPGEIAEVLGMGESTHKVLQGRAGVSQANGSWRRMAGSLTRVGSGACPTNKAAGHLYQGTIDCYSALSAMRVPTVFWMKASGRC